MNTFGSIEANVRPNLLAIVLGAVLAFSLAVGQENGQPLPAPEFNLDTSPLRREVRLATSFAPVVEKAAPSVVSVFATRRVSLSDGELSRDDFFRRFFGLPDADGSERSRLQQSLGSGVIVTKDGYILSNNHVVDEGEEIKVVLPGSGKEYAARVIGKDPETDVAVLKIDATDLPAITIADSDLLQVGDVVLAIGNPFDVGQTVTMGIVGATRRGDFRMFRYEDFIQTDASINQGNSGGALIDAEGRLVGINTFILSPTGGNLGIGFAIPVNMARNVMTLLIKEGRVIRGYIGVELEERITSELAREFNLDDLRGAIVTDIVEGTPGEKAGLKPGDVIVQFNGRRVEDRRHLQLMASQTAPGTEVQLNIIRDGRERTIPLTLGEFPAGQLADSRGMPGVDEPSDALRGIEVMDITPQLREQFGIPRTVNGALITEVEPDTPAAKEGLRAGQVILEIDKQAVTNADDAVRLGRGAQRDTVLLRVWSSTGTKYVPLENSSDKR